MKYCECGCGNPVALASSTHRNIGHICGQPVRFIRGHNLNGGGYPKGYTIDKQGRKLIYSKTHPRRGKNKLIFEHILIAESVFGKFLPKKAVIHHVDGDKSNNSKNNLVICENQAYHNYLHMRMAALKECGNPSARRCIFCRKWDNMENMFFISGGRAPAHRECYRAYDRIRNLTRVRKKNNRRIVPGECSPLLRDGL